MRLTILPIAGFALLTAGVTAALAASPAYCELYAREYVRYTEAESEASSSSDLAQSRAYHKCLNMDDEPILPTASVDAGEAGVGEGGVGGPFVAFSPSSDPTIDHTLGADTTPDEAVAEPANDVEMAAQSAPTDNRTDERRGSGLEAWSPEWRAWCADHFPNSFDPQTGTIVPYETGVRTMCR